MFQFFFLCCSLSLVRSFVLHLFAILFFSFSLVLYFSLILSLNSVKWYLVLLGPICAAAPGLIQGQARGQCHNKSDQTLGGSNRWARTPTGASLPQPVLEVVVGWKVLKRTRGKGQRKGTGEEVERKRKMGLADCGWRGCGEQCEREREWRGGGCAWRGAYVIHYFHCRKWKAVSGMGPRGRAMGASTGNTKQGWGEEWTARERGRARERECMRERESRGKRWLSDTLRGVSVQAELPERTLQRHDGFPRGRSDGRRAQRGSRRPSLRFPDSSGTPSPYRLLSIYLSDQELGDGALGFSRRGNSPKANLSPR